MPNLDFALQRKNVELWLEALDSGRYQQGNGVLRRNDDFCCLGVACDVLKVPSKTEFGVFHMYGPYEETLVLPEDIRSALGLRTKDGEFIEGYDDLGEIISSLTIHNDGSPPGALRPTYAKTFKEIAAIIRSHPKGLFVEGMYDD